MLSFWLGVYYGCVLGFLSATCYRHWVSLYEYPDTPEMDKEEFESLWERPRWRRSGP